MSAIGLPPIPALERVRNALPEGGITIGWLHDQLKSEAVYLLLFVVALVGAVPGLSVPAGIVVCILAGGMMFSRRNDTLPGVIASRHIGADATRYVLGRAIIVLRFFEAILPLSRNGVFASARLVAAWLLCLLGCSMLVPIPFSNVVPALVAAGLALALIEDSLLLCVLASTAAVAVLSLMVAGFLLLFA
jgi:hypothetical protein